MKRLEVSTKRPILTAEKLATAGALTQRTSCVSASSRTAGSGSVRMERGHSLAPSARSGSHAARDAEIFAANAARRSNHDYERFGRMTTEPRARKSPANGRPRHRCLERTPPSQSAARSAPRAHTSATRCLARSHERHHDRSQRGTKYVASAKESGTMTGSGEHHRKSGFCTPPAWLPNERHRETPSAMQDARASACAESGSRSCAWTWPRSRPWIPQESAVRPCGGQSRCSPLTNTATRSQAGMVNIVSNQVRRAAECADRAGGAPAAAVSRSCHSLLRPLVAAPEALSDATWVFRTRLALQRAEVVASRNGRARTSDHVVADSPTSGDRGADAAPGCGVRSASLRLRRSLNCVR